MMKKPIAYSSGGVATTALAIIVGTMIVMLTLATFVPTTPCKASDPHGPRIGSVIRIAGCP